MRDGTDELRVCGLTLRGITRGGVQTCVMVPELDLMFDVGGFASGALRYRTILVTHGHQDHLGGLPYLASQRQLNGLAGPRVHVPREVVDPMERIFAAWSEIEGFSVPVELTGHDPGDRVELPRDLTATCLRSVHRVPSLAWVVERRARRLKPELRELDGAEIAKRRSAGEEITDDVVVPLLCVTGDTQIDLFAGEPAVRSCKVLVHEVTGWDGQRSVEQIREWGHTHVDEVIAHCERFEGDALVLVHRSERHTRSQAERVVRERFPADVRDRVHVFGN